MPLRLRCVPTPQQLVEPAPGHPVTGALAVARQSIPKGLDATPSAAARRGDTTHCAASSPSASDQ